MNNKSILIAGSKDVDKRIFAITLAEHLASQGYLALIITKSFDFLPEPLHGRYRDSEDYSNITLRYPQTIAELGAILFDFSLFRRLSKSPFTIIVENIEDFCTGTEQIARLTAAVLGASPYHVTQVCPKLIVTLNLGTNDTSIAPLASLFDCVWESEKTGKSISLSSQGRQQINFEELELSSDCPLTALRLKSILQKKLI